MDCDQRGCSPFENVRQVYEYNVRGMFMIISDISEIFQLWKRYYVAGYVPGACGSTVARYGAV